MNRPRRLQATCESACPDDSGKRCGVTRLVIGRAGIDDEIDEIALRYGGGDLVRFARSVDELLEDLFPIHEDATDHAIACWIGIASVP